MFLAFTLIEMYIFIFKQMFKRFNFFYFS